MSDYVAVLGLETEIRVFIDPDYVSIPWASNIALPGITTDMVDATTNSSPNGFREKIPGLKDLGDITFTINWHDDEEAHQILWDMQQASELGQWQIAFPQFATNNLYEFDAYVTGLPIDSPLDGIVIQNVTLTGSGNIERSTE